MRLRLLFKYSLSPLVVAFAILAGVSAVLAQTTAFTYQGKLTDGANPANGNYDLQFALFDAGGTQIGSPLTRAGTNVSGGIFTVQLDFGVSAFSGSNRFLEIGVRPAGGSSFTILSPRQQISSTPYAIRTLSAGNADGLSSACVACVQDSQINAVAGSKVSGTIPVAGVPAGSSNYIQNTNSQQASANFNISGNGTIGGNFIANGRVGIGTNAPAQSLEVNGITSMGVPGSVYGYLVPGSSPGPYPTIGFNTYGPSYLAGTTGYGGIFQFQNSDGKLIYYTGSPIAAGQPHVSPPVFTIDAQGNVGIGTTSPQRLLHAAGRARIGAIPLEASAASVCFNPAGDLLQCGASSLRFKTNVTQFRSGLDIVRRLRPISFDWKDGSGHDIGLGAEDVAKVAPTFTFIDANGEVTGVKYERLNMLLINAVKEQQTQIEQQQKLIKLQGVRLSQQQQQLESLKRLVCRKHARAAICK